MTILDFIKVTLLYAMIACAEGYLDYSAGQVLNADGGFALRRL